LTLLLLRRGAAPADPFVLYRRVHAYRELIEITLLRLSPPDATFCCGFRRGDDCQGAPGADDLRCMEVGSPVVLEFAADSEFLVCEAHPAFPATHPRHSTATCRSRASGPAAPRAGTAPSRSPSAPPAQGPAAAPGGT
jgi:hypothetical protein